MVTFETKIRPGANGVTERAIFIDGELMDFTIDLSSYLEAAKMGPQYLRAAKESIAKYFLEAVSETLGRRVTAEEIKTASKTGWI